MHAPIRWAAFRTLMLQFAFGVFYSASAMIILGVLSEWCFPKHSDWRIARPAIPMTGMLVIGLVATRLSRSEAKRGYVSGLWFGGFVFLGLIGLHLISIGYVRWVEALL
jgi:hypothetical protein